MKRIALIGFGEAGGILGEDLVRGGAEVRTYDILLDDPATAPTLRAKAQAAGVRVTQEPAEAIVDADLVIAAVTASSSTDAAREAAKTLIRGQVYLDINSVSPATRRINAEFVEAGGASYVEAAVMAPVPPYRLAVPMLLGGPHAARVAPQLQAGGLRAVAFAEQLGAASAVKMCRSVVIKGIEALTVEALFAARSFGVEDHVLESLQRSFPHMGWEGGFADYTIGRIAVHGERRAAEMREVVRTLQETGVEPLMSAATAERQLTLVETMRAQDVACADEASFSWRDLCDRLR